MSGRGHPRRQRGAAAAGLAIAAALWLGLAASAAPQGPREDSRARTQIGGATSAARCANAVSMGQQDEAALSYCNSAIERDRLVRADRVAALTNRGVLFLRRRDGAAALADFDAAIALDPEAAEAFLNRGAAFVMLGQPGPAVSSITEALSLGVREPHKAYFNRGAAREALGDIRGAYEDYTTALEIQPDWGPAEAELARFVRSRQQRLAEIISAEEASSTP